MPTLARLSFWIPPDRLDDFEAAYEKKIMPILKEHGLAHSSELDRAAAQGVFSRSFELRTPTEVVETQRRLQRDSTFRDTLRHLGATLAPEVPLRFRFGIYATPAGAGKLVKAGTGSHQGVWYSMDVSDGLPSPLIRDIIQDRTGDLWLACGYEGGICRYDGETFVSFGEEDGLPDADVLCVLEDRAGNLWLGTEEGGVCRYDGDRFITFTTEDGLASNRVYTMLEDRHGNVWFGTVEGVSRYDGEEFAAFTAGDALTNDWICSILEDGEGNLWFGYAEGGGVGRYDGEELLSFRTAEGLRDSRVGCIAQNRAGDLWFGTADGGVSRYDGNPSFAFTRENSLTHSWVHAIFEDRERNLWFATAENVVWREGNTFVVFTPEDGLAHHHVFAILEDRSGSLWFATAGGVSRYDGYRFASFTAEGDLVGNGVMSALEDQEGNLWFGTWDGVSRYDGEQWVTEAELVDRNTYAIVEGRNGNLWFGAATGGVMIRNNEGEFAPFTTEDGPASDNVLSLHEDRSRNLWFGTDEGVRRYDGRNCVTFTVEDGLGDDLVHAILEDREGNLWFGTRGGVSRYDGCQFTSFTTEDGLGDDLVHAILEDREGNLWFATAGGAVSRYDGSTFVTFTMRDGLTNNTVMSILEDREGNLWFGTFGGGMSRFDGLVFQNLLRRDGLVNNVIQDILQDRNGDIWIATEGGVTRYRPDHTPPRIRLTDVVTGRRHGPVEEIQVSASQTPIVFEFQGRSLMTHWSRMAYAVWLEGCDAGWRQVREGRVEYTDLPTGEYVFHARAVDQDLNYSEPIRVRVTVEPDLRLEALTEVLREAGPTGEFVGESAALRRMQIQLRAVAPTDLTVLILGETGTGKGLAARTLHERSTRSSGPFIKVLCGAIPEGLVESELFGHERGAFTGAVSRKLGKVELAAGGTLFLDEIGDLPLTSQVKLLRFLEEHRFERVGGTETMVAEVRIVAATNRDLQEMVDIGTFREDLYYRLQAFMLEVPPLRERREDLLLLVRYFAERFAAHLNRPVPEIDPSVMTHLHRYPWPGNVRELEHQVQRAVLSCRDQVIQLEDLLTGGMEARRSSSTQAPLSLEEQEIRLREQERRQIEEALEATDWVIYGEHGAAHLLGMHPEKLRYRMRKHGLRRPE